MRIDVRIYSQEPQLSFIASSDGFQPSECRDETGEPRSMRRLVGAHRPAVAEHEREIGNLSGNLIPYSRERKQLRNAFQVAELLRLPTRLAPRHPTGRNPTITTPRHLRPNRRVKSAKEPCVPSVWSIPYTRESGAVMKGWPSWRSWQP